MGGGGGGGTGAGGAGVDGEYAEAKTSVWWDIENCQVPRGCDPYNIAQNIRGALSDAGYRGMVSVSAYGDTNKIPTSVQQALSSTGIALNHVPAGVKDASDKKILVDMLFWAVDNPPPANYLLISGDRDFSNALHQLRMRRYNILLAHSPNVSQALVAAAKCVWLWTSLVAGEPPLQSSEPSQLGSMTNGNGSGMDIPKNSNTDMKQSVDSSLESAQNENQKIYGNGKSDRRYKAKPSWKSVPQPSITRSTSSEFKQPTTSTQSLVDGTAYPPNLNWVSSQHQQNPALTPVVAECEPHKSVQSNDAATTSSTVTNTASSTVTPSTPETLVDPCFSDNMVYPDAKQFREAPHKFFGYAPSAFNGAAQNNSLPCTEISPKKWNNSHDNSQTQNPQILRPSDFLPQQPALVPGNLYTTNSLKHSSSQQQLRPDGLPILSSPAGVPDINKLRISQIPGGEAHIRSQFYTGNPEPRTRVVSDPSGFPQNLHFSNSLTPPQHNRMHNINHFYGLELRPPLPVAMTGQGPVSGALKTSGCPQPSDEALFHIGHILNALDFLKTDMMLPTEENIADCIRYRINLPNFWVSMGLDYALKNQMIVKVTLGKLSCYIGKNERMWNCVNIMDVNAKHPKTMWDKIQGFLFSPDGRAKMMSSYCRYQAAIAIKNSGFDDIPLGTMLQILNMIVTVKKWVVPHPSGWQPLSFGPQLTSEKNASGSRSTSI